MSSDDRDLSPASFEFNSKLIGGQRIHRSAIMRRNGGGEGEPQLSSVPSSLPPPEEEAFHALERGVFQVCTDGR